jgi:hypothetical protein
MSHENVQENGKDIGNITDHATTKEFEPSHNAPEAPEAPYSEGASQNARTQPTEHDLPMPEELEDGLDTVSERARGSYIQTSGVRS